MGTPTIFFAFSKKHPLILTKKNSRCTRFFIIPGALANEKFKSTSMETCILIQQTSGGQY